MAEGGKEPNAGTSIWGSTGGDAAQSRPVTLEGVDLKSLLRDAICEVLPELLGEKAAPKEDGSGQAKLTGKSYKRKQEEFGPGPMPPPPLPPR